MICHHLKDIDEAWYAHVLRTKNYASFCLQVFGDFLHYTPGEDGKKAQNHKFESMFEQYTQRFYHEEFGEYIYAIRLVSMRVLLSMVFKKLCNLNWLKVFKMASLVSFKNRLFYSKR